MSVPSIIRDVELVGEHLFDHTPIVRNEINRFVERFEKNERHREFDGILRTSHALIEAVESPVEALFNTGKMRKITDDINALTTRIQDLIQPQYGKEHEIYLADIAKSQREYLDLCRSEALRKMRNLTQ
uniref:Biogenesis of lysosome-related organelles complex 1 subunit 5 n=1 Tax=Heterorhabditis bacteriophora TaxID=37862 RepID=A0A1I7WSP1_HETBA